MGKLEKVSEDPSLKEGMGKIFFLSFVTTSRFFFLPDYNNGKSNYNDCRLKKLSGFETIIPEFVSPSLFRASTVRKGPTHFAQKTLTCDSILVI